MKYLPSEKGKDILRAGTLLRWRALKNVFKSELRTESTILDIGGYDGYISYRIKKNFPNIKIAVVDINSSVLQLAKKRDLNTLNASALKLPIGNNQLDVILCFDLIEHIKEDERLIEEISRVMKQNGKVILTTPMQDGISFPFLSKDKIEVVNRNWGHQRKGYNLERLRSLFEANNLVILKTGKYFNLLSRFVYWFVHFSDAPIKGRSLLFRIVIQLEPYIKYRAEEHIIIGSKVQP